MAADDSEAKYFLVDLESVTSENQAFRNVIFTIPTLQLVLMCLLPGEEIEMEVHPHNAQFFRCEKGHGQIHIKVKDINGERIDRLLLKEGYAAVVNPGTWHRVINTSKTENFQFYTIYTPAHHPPGLVQEYPSS